MKDIDIITLYSYNNSFGAQGVISSYRSLEVKVSCVLFNPRNTLIATGSGERPLLQGHPT